MDLKQLREKIDNVDTGLLKLFEERMDVVSEIAAYKQANGLPVVDRSRENEKLKAISTQVRPELIPFAHTLYDILFELSHSRQHIARAKDGLTPMPLRQEIQAALDNTPKLFPETATVACQGVEGAFSQLAATRFFKRPDIQYFRTFDSVFAAVENGFCKYGILPLENSTAGSVNKIYDLMQQHKCKIAKSLRMKIDHNLVAPKGVKLEDIREVFSHEQALAQCAAFLEKYPNITITVSENTAIAAKAVAESPRRDIAAICGHNCIGLYGLNCLARDIQDHANNYTRFICISKNLEIYPGADRTSVMIVLSHTPGALYKVLARFYALGVNLIKLESRPIPERDFEFRFYFDLETSVYSDAFMQLMDSMQEICAEFEYFGSYVEVM